MELGGLEEIRVSIRDDRPARRPHTAGPPTAEEIAAQVWGPYQFSPYADGADAHGRTVDPFPLKVGDRQRLSLKQTRAPHWTTQEWWWDEFGGEPVRLELHCRRDNRTAPWVVPVQVPVTSPPRPPGY